MNLPQTQAWVKLSFFLITFFLLIQSLIGIRLDDRIDRTNARIMQVTQASFNSEEMPKCFGICLYSNAVVFSSGSNYIALNGAITSGGNIGIAGVTINLTNHSHLTSPFTNALIEIGP